MEVLRSKRLTLQRLTEGDIPAIVDGCNDAAVVAYIPVIPSPYGEADARAWLASASERWTEKHELDLAIRRAGNTEFLGVLTLRLRPGGSVGYWLSPLARGSGVMTEALAAGAEWAERKHGARQLFLTAHPNNVASQRAAEKAGFIRTGLVQHEPPFRDGVSVAVRFQRPPLSN
jgi:RimJ/RimL family protein N-acetyltransferase